MSQPAAFYWAVMDRDDPEVWPGAEPWRDRWGSFGTLPDARGLGATVSRTRVPPAELPSFWASIEARYPRLPKFTVGPGDTPGLAAWLSRHGYVVETRETALVLPRADWARIPKGPVGLVQEVKAPPALRQVIALDHLVFDDPLLGEEEIQRELTRLGRRRRLYLIPGPDMALATGGFTAWSRWALLWGAETHPAHRGRGYYHAILAARLDALTSLAGVEFAAVFANDETSAPILGRLGLLPIGELAVWKPA
jgi:hypothetical protein